MSRKHLFLILKLAISVGLIWYLLRDLDFAAAAGRLLAADPFYLSLAIATTLLQVLTSVMRWRIVLNAIDAILPYALSMKLYLIGLFFNQLLPSAVGGDAVRGFLGYRAGLALSQAVHSVMLERVATVFSLVILGVCTAPFFIQSNSEADLGWLMPFLGAALLGSLAGIFVLVNLHRMHNRWSGYRIVRILSNLSDDARRTFLSARSALPVLIVSALGHVLISVAVYFIAKAIQLDIGVIDCIILMPPVMLVATLPISIAGWGVRESSMVVAFGLIGVGSAEAIIVSLLFGFLAILFALPGGAVWLLSDNHNMETLEED